MPDSRTAGALLLKELAMFDEAARLFEHDVSPEVCKNLNDAFADWAEEKGWKGAFGWGLESADDETWIAPVGWVLSEGKKPNWLAYFTFITEKDSNSYPVANLCGAGDCVTGFYFDIHDYKDFGGKKKWLSVCSSFAEEDKTSLRNLGFIYDGSKGRFFKPIQLDLEKILSCWDATR